MRQPLTGTFKMRALKFLLNLSGSNHKAPLRRMLMTLLILRAQNNKGFAKREELWPFHNTIGTSCVLLFQFLITPLYLSLTILGK